MASSLVPKSGMDKQMYAADAMSCLEIVYAVKTWCGLESEDMQTAQASEAKATSSEQLQHDIPSHSQLLEEQAVQWRFPTCS